ncbi:50S ribosomal protein L18 [Candidatus Babeliales bacterium]|nr:50S ribosomal protein L18 [Candidatus Babeliales bacterium]
MSIQKSIALRAKKRALRNRKKMMSRGSKLRVSIFRSLHHIGAQIIDDVKKHTILSLSSSITSFDGDKTSVARQVGIALGEQAAKQDIKDVFFDRGQYKYHGRVQAFAEGLRESGLQF